MKLDSQNIVVFICCLGRGFKKRKLVSDVFLFWGLQIEVNQYAQRGKEYIH